ncbi:MAG: hypothetical protein RR744_09270 [Cellulosilyticaceae bacterium]
MKYSDICCKENLNRVYLVDFLDGFLNGKGMELRVAFIDEKYVFVDKDDDEEHCWYYPESFVKEIIKDVTPLKQLELF